MRSPLFARWLKSLKSGLLAPRLSRPARPPRLSMEALEDRSVPATHTWIGMGNANWSVASNWMNNSPPTVGESNVTVVFASNTTSNQDIAGLNVDELIFTGANNAITLTQPLTLRGSAGTDTISSTTGANSITASAPANTLTLGGTAPTTVRVPIGAGGPIINITAVLAGSQGLTKVGGSVLALASVGNAASTYTGVTTVADGELRLNTSSNNGGFGATSAVMVGDNIGGASSAVLTLNGSNQINDAASVVINGDGVAILTRNMTEEISGPLAFNGGALRVDNDAFFRVQSGGTVTATGATGSQFVGNGFLDLTAATTFTVADGPTAADLTLAGRVSGGQAITKTGAGTLTITGGNPAGAVTSVAVNQGALELNAPFGALTNTPVTLSGTGSLAGSGTIGNVTAATGTTVSPGLSGSPRTLTTGNLTFGASTFRPVVTTNFGRDRITATGTVDLTGATLAPNVLSSAPVGTPFVVIAVPGTLNPATGRFANAATEGATVTGANGQTFTVSYMGGDGNDVTLTPTTTGTNLTLSVNSPSQAEGNAANNLTFTVTLSAASTNPVTVQFVTASGTATAGSDFTSTAGTLTFMPGALTQTITVPILGDTASESNENFTVVLTNPNGAVITTGTGTATLTNDDGTATTQTLSVNSPSQPEGNAANNLTFTVNMSAPSANTVTVQFATASGTAMAGSDFTATTGTVTFVPGVTSQTITIPILGDTTAEADETFIVTLTNATGGATIGTATGTATLTDDDAGTGTGGVTAVSDVLTVVPGVATTFTAADLIANDQPTGQVAFAGSVTTNATGGTTIDQSLVNGQLTLTITAPAGATGQVGTGTYTIRPAGQPSATPVTGTFTVVAGTTMVPPTVPPMSPPAVSPPTVSPPPPPFFSGAQVAGNVLTVSGAGVAGGQLVLPLPAGSSAFFADVSGDGKGDVILFLPTGVFVFNGATGGFFLAFFDSNGDGVKELIRF